MFPFFCPFVFQSCFSYFSSFFFEATGGGAIALPPAGAPLNKK